MVHFEQKFIYPLIERKSFSYFRYIDDTFLIWTETKNDFDQFFKDLNKLYPSIKLDYKAAKDRILFLDTEVYLHNDKLHAKIHRKVTDLQHYVRIKSEHPESLTDTSPYSQAIQIKELK